MTLIQNFIKYVALIIKILLYEWLPSLLRICCTLVSYCKYLCKKRQLPQWERKTNKTRCAPVKEPAFKQPDPMIYSQSYLMKLGLAVTWDNPDIQLWKDGVPVPSSELELDTEYEIVARIWNNSTEAPIIGLPVRFSYLSFGIGTKSNEISDPIHPPTINLGVKGDSNHPAFASMKWKTPSKAGHYCIQVLLDWLDDANPLNNLGQENTNVGEAHSPAEFTFTLRNDTREAQTFHFEVDTYQIPKLPQCDGQERKRKVRGRTNKLAGEPVQAIPQQHNKLNYPVPDGWSIEINPPLPELKSDQEELIQVKITPPDGFKGNQPFNVNAYHRYGLAGGVTLYVVAK